MTQYAPAKPTEATIDAGYMRRALDLAVGGRGRVEPNPMVGCVIVKEGRVIGQGRHEAFGGPHAEPNALLKCEQSPAGATAYVTLEPCCHVEKKTPPCVPQLLEAGIERVVVGSLDPNPQVAGKGVAQLVAAGVRVDAGVLGAECQQLNAAFFARVVHRRPYVTLKWAQTADGKVAGPAGKRVFISNETSHKVLHALRARCDAILVGIRTVLNDDPMLTARNVQTPRPLLRVVLDRDLRIPASSQLARTAAHGPVAVFCGEEAFGTHYAAAAALMANHVQVVPLPLDAGGELSLPHFLAELGKRPITHLLVEPGPTLAGSFLRANLADRVWIFRSPKRIDDPTAPAAQPVDYPPTGEKLLAGDRLTEYLNPRSSVFFANQPSADFVLVNPG